MTPSVNTWVAALALAAIAGCSDRPKPNVLFILVDDLGWADVSFNNPQTFYDTPNLARLAEESVRFTDAYAAAPVCSPTRASILTGRYPARTATTDWFGAPQPETASGGWLEKPLLPARYEDRMDLAEVTLAETFRDAGYRTFFAGKWHLGPEGWWPEDQGFEINRGGIERGGPYGGDRYFSPYGNPRLEDGPPGEHLPDRLARETVDFVDAPDDRPFFAYLSFYSVHTPLMARPDLQARYEARPAPPDAWGREGERAVRLVQNHAVYAGMVDAMDQAVGRVLDHLRATGRLDDTIVVFFSDNGGLSTSEGHPTSNLPLRAGKGWLYEGGIREPLLVRLPEGRRGASVVPAPVTSVDFYPTLLELAGIEPPPGQAVDGRSLVGLLEGRREPERAIYWHYPHYGNQGGSPSAAVRLGRYKLIRFFEDDRVELYDLADDVGETRDLADSLTAVRDSLAARLEAWQAAVSARFPTPNPVVTR